MINHAKKFIKEYSLTKTNLTPARLEQIIKNHGFAIIRFERSANNNYVSELLNTLKLSHMIKSHNGFSYEDENNGFVFIKNKLTEQERKNAYLHELAHIRLNHLRFSGNEILQEFEAETFSICVKALLWLKRIAKSAALIAVLIAVGIIGANISGKNETANYTTEQFTAPISSVLPDSDTVYITKSGKKYHKRLCRHIKNSNTLFDIPIEKAENAGYEPCKDCFAELYK